jgi:SET domain-containing protein
MENHKIVFDSSKIYIDKSNIHGRGVFAREDISQDEIIEIFPIVPIQFRTNYQFDPAIINYSFINDACNCEECKKHGHIIYLALGYGGLYNFANLPDNKYNAYTDINYSSYYGIIKANRNINKDEEILLNIKNSFYFKQITSYENTSNQTNIYENR